MVSIRDDLRFSVKFGLSQGLRRVRGMRRQVTDAERDRIAEAIVDYLFLANWKIEKGPPLAPHGTGAHFSPKPRRPEPAGR
jgi:hypothetical protein